MSLVEFIGRTIADSDGEDYTHNSVTYDRQANAVIKALHLSDTAITVKATNSKNFEEFWYLYPNKVGKREGQKAFDKACKRVRFSDMMDGLRRYVSKSDDRAWCNPATWLNQDRWEDQPAMVAHKPRLTEFQARNRALDDAFFDTRMGNGKPNHNGPELDLGPTDYSSHDKTASFNW